MSTLHNFVSQKNISAEEFISSLNKNLKSLRQSLLDETVLRTPLNYNQKKSDFITNLNSIFPNLSKEQQESVAIILNENGELNLLNTENLRLLDKDFLEKNKRLPNKLLNQIGKALGTISSYLGMTILAFSPLDSSLLIPGALLTGAGFTIKEICHNNLDKRAEIINDYESKSVSADLGLNQDLDVVPEKITEKNNDVKINLSVEKANLDRGRYL